MKNLRHAAGILAFCVACASTGAHAQHLVASYNNWRVFTVKKNGDTMCYIASLPTKKQGNYSNRSEPYALVTFVHNGADEVSASSGYRYKDGTDIDVSVDGETFKFFTKGELGWAYDSKTDKALVEKMMDGANMTVKGRSWKGTHSTDTYSLKGFTAAYKRMHDECK